jgi:uncharacterized protein YcaQ
VLPAALRRYLHPRATQRTWHVERERPELARAILDHIGRAGPTHPRDLHRAFGRDVIVNGWGGRSVATTRMLEVLHYRGRLHVVRREDGIKIYGLAPALARPLSARTRALRVLDLLVRLYAPVHVSTLRELARMAGDDDVSNEARDAIVARFLASDALEHGELDGARYVWPADDPPPAPAPEERVRLLAPFDPFVWDRRRFEQLHGWDYRFEAYTPAKKRRFGYYALPLVWRDRAIGWANVARAGAGIDVRTGFVGAAPRGRPFARRARGRDRAPARVPARRRAQGHERYPNSRRGLISMTRTSRTLPESMMRKASPSSASTSCRTISSGNVNMPANGSQS